MASYGRISSSAPPVSHQDTVESAGRMIDIHLQDDRTSLDLSELLRVPVHTQPSVSGLHDYDYPSLINTGFGNDILSEISRVDRFPLPPELVEQFGRMQCSCTMGLFVDIERAWLSIDSDIFVWKYENGGDLAYFDGMNETILATALVKPKAGIFQPNIKFLLVLASPIEIAILGVSFANTQSKYDEMHLLPEPLFSIPTDNVYAMNIVGTDTGRIFMGGKDGSLYEVSYQADGWFRRKCRLINHSKGTLSYFMPSFLSFSFSEQDALVQIAPDNSRNILYCRTQKGALFVYDLGNDGKGLSKVAAVPLQKTVYNASHIARTIDRSQFKSIVHISPLTRMESSNIHLVAVTDTGVRLFFTTNPFGSSTSRPSMLHLVHVRLPPGYLTTATPQKPNNVHMAHHKEGCMVLLGSQNDSSDLMWVMSGDTFPFQNQLMESYATVPVDGKAWAISEVDYVDLKPLSERNGGITGRDPPSVVTQHAKPPRKFVILNAQGSHIFSKLRPVDQLHQLLIDCQGHEAEEVKAFFRLHKTEQACATCLILACSRLATEENVANWAKMAFFLYGGEAQYSYGAGRLSGDRPMMPANITPAGLHPAQTPATLACSLSVIHAVTGLSGEKDFQYVTFSGKHNGICLYLSRILRPLWDTLIVTDLPLQTPEGTVNYLTSTFSDHELGFVLDNIRQLSDFVDFNSKFDSGPSDSGNIGSIPYTPHIMGHVEEQRGRKLQVEAQKMEKLSLQNIQDLIHRVEEVLGLLKILVENRLHLLTAMLSKDQQNQLRSFTFKQFVINGKEMCGVLIQCLVNGYLNDKASTDAISTKLREVCPSLYSTDDATCSKANELLQAAKSSQNPSEMKRYLYESLKLYRSVSHPLHLSEVCSQFASVHFYEGIVDLCLTMAKKRDPHQLALHFHNNDEPQEDMQGVQELMQRKECYKCITETLGYLMTASVPQGATAIPQSPGPPSAPDSSRMSVEDAELYKEEVFRLALKSDDELFHVSLYDWMFSMNLTEKLLTIQSPFLEPYLKRRAYYQSGDISALDLLWKYYEKTENYPGAARILSRLAERHGTDIDLQKRIVYLSRAIMCAKSATSRSSSPAEGEFLHELEEKMEVARLQKNVLQALTQDAGGRADVQDAIVRLESDLVDITMLYGEYAERFDLSECKLAIVHCAGLYDSALVETLWQNIIDKEIDNNRASAPSILERNVSYKLLAIGKTYIKAERYFPCAFIVKYLEQKGCELSLDAGWVHQLMLNIGVPALRLLELYDRMFKSRDPYWMSVNRPLHLLFAIHSLLNRLADNRSLILAYDRRRFSPMGLDYIASYLVELQSIGSVGDPNVRVLINQFKSLQAKLDRF